MKKRAYALFAAAAACAALLGCSKSNALPDLPMADTGQAEKETVDLVLWGAQEDEELLSRIVQDFKIHYREDANFNITYAPQGESNCKDALMAALEESADVFAFADDQLNTLVAAGALEPVEDAATISEENLEGAVEAASVGGTLYAYPLTADNGYFLYYNKRYLTDEDVKTLDKILEAAADSQRKMAMDWSSAWYVYSFFGNTGLEVGLNKDGITNFCTWNSTDGPVKGIDVAKAMLSISASPGFYNVDDTGFLAGVQDGSVIAGVSGVWNAVAVKEAWGDDYGAAKLPTYTCAGKQIQMASFSGYKLIGVNAYSKQYKWASLLARWITNEENQQLRFELRGQGPSNRNAAASAAVQDSPAIAALIEQSDFSCLQRISGKFWDPVSAFSLKMAAGNPEREDLQTLLDLMVQGVTSP